MVRGTRADFWDVKKFPGKRVLALQPQETLEIALLADGGLVFVPGLIGMDYSAIPKGTAYRDQSYALLKTFEDPQWQAKFTGIFPYSPTSKKRLLFLILSRRPTSP